MRRHASFPKAGDRIRLEVPLPKGATSKARRGTVLERSCGKSGALRVRWDGDGDRDTTEGWLSDAGWHWSHGHLGVLPAGAGPEPAAVAPPAGEAAEAADLWLSGSPRARSTPVAVGPGTAAGAAFDEWEAALVAETAPADDDSWEDALAVALGLGETQRVPAGPQPPAKVPVTPVRLTTPAHAAPAGPVATRAPAHAPRPGAPVAAAVAADDRPAAPAPPTTPAAPRAWSGDDILPNRNGRKGRRRG